MDVIKKMKKEIKNPFPDGNCFFCGNNNKFGLKLKFYWDEEKKETSTEYLPAKYFTGQGKILHGAIQMGLLDEIMGWTSYAFTKKMAVTSDLNVKFFKPTYINGEKIRITCQVTSKDGTKIKMHAKLFNISGVICTEAVGSYHLLSSEKYRNIIQ
jgi:acyl-coenzyme A thioesterase PaaI-like protein